MTFPGGRQLRELRGLNAFRHRNYRLFFVGQLVSLVGTWMQTVAQAWLVLQLSNDPFALGLLSVAQFGPVMILGLFGGVIADNLPKRQTLIATQATQMALALVLALLAATGVVQVWHILVMATLLGVANAVDMPTRQSFVVEMVGREDIANAVAFNSAMFNAARVVGPAIAGVTIGVFGVPLCFFFNGVSFIAVIVGLVAMRDWDSTSARGSRAQRRSRRCSTTSPKGFPTSAGRRLCCWPSQLWACRPRLPSTSACRYRR